MVRAGTWLTKRRGILLSPLFAVALISCRQASHFWIELSQDLTGLACLIAGTRLRLVAASYHDSSHHAEPITAGPYAWVRHPLYIANFLLGLGIMLLAGWWPLTVVYARIFFPLHTMIMRSEEVHLTQLYGQKYTVYLRAVPGIFPWRRYRGYRYGSRSDFKLKQGRERLKVVGYLAGMAALLLLKQYRPMLARFPIPPLQPPWAVAMGTVALLAVIYRPTIRSPWLRVCQTALTVTCVLFLSVHLPGVWPSQPSTRSIKTVEAAVLVPAPLPEKQVSTTTPPAEDDQPAAPVGRPRNLTNQFWSRLELLVGASA